MLERPLLQKTCMKTASCIQHHSVSQNSTLFTYDVGVTLHQLYNILTVINSLQCILSQSNPRQTQLCGNPKKGLPFAHYHCHRSITCTELEVCKIIPACLNMVTISHCLPIGHFWKDWQKLLQLSRNDFTPDLSAFLLDYLIVFPLAMPHFCF